MTNNKLIQPIDLKALNKIFEFGIKIAFTKLNSYMVMNQTTLLTPCNSSDSPHIRLLLLTLNVPLNENEK